MGVGVGGAAAGRGGLRVVAWVVVLGHGGGGVGRGRRGERGCAGRGGWGLQNYLSFYTHRSEMGDVWFVFGDRSRMFRCGLGVALRSVNY